MNEETTDLTLIENIQNNKKQEDSLNALVERHSGIYLEMVNSYASPNSPFIDYNDLVNDKEYKIYTTQFDEIAKAETLENIVYVYMFFSGPNNFLPSSKGQIKSAIT